MGNPGNTGLRRIRNARGPNDTTPILAFTADADPAARAKFVGMGFESVVAKPVTPQSLIAAVARASAFVEQLQEISHAA